MSAQINGSSYAQSAPFPTQLEPNLVNLTSVAQQALEHLQPIAAQLPAQTASFIPPPTISVQTVQTAHIHLFDSHLGDIFDSIVDISLKEEVKWHLYNWIAQAGSTPDAFEAARRIVQCLCHQHPDLRLCDLALNTLPDVFGHLTFLRFLSFGGSELCQLPPSVSLLSELRKLEISNSLLGALPDSLSSLSRLEKLSVCSRRLAHLPPVIWKLIKIDSLHLRCPLLSELPNEIASLSHLKQLFIFSSSLTGLPATFSTIQSIESLSINQSLLRELPDCVFALKNLKQLSLDSNRIQKLPSQIKSLKGLERLCLSANSLTQIPESIGELDSLIELSLHNNQIKDLPDSFGCLSSLEILDLSANRLEYLPKGLLELPCKVEFLDLSCNRISILPAYFVELSSVTHLDLSHNLIRSLDDCPFIFQLRDLNVSYNRIEAFPQIFINPQDTECKIEVLNLSHNPIRSLPTAPLQHLSKLRWFELTYTQLEVIPESLGELVQIEHLALSQNPLTFLPQSLGNLRNLACLDVRDTSVSELPSSLISCSALSDIRTYGSSITIQIVEALIQAIASYPHASAEFSHLQLPAYLKLWQSTATEPTLLDPILSWDEPAQQTILDWLRRLERTRDFRGRKEPIAQAVCLMLQQACQSPSFRQTLLLQAQVNNEGCQDRAAMALNELFTSYKLDTIKDLPSSEQDPILIAAAKTVTLRKYIAQKIAERQAYLDKENPQFAPHEILESVEIYLYYELALCRSLNLLNVIKSMTYMQIGHVSWIDELSAQTFVEAHYQQELLTLPACMQLAESCPYFHRIKDDKQASCHELLENLETLNLPEDLYLQKTQALQDQFKKAHTESLSIWLNFRPLLLEIESLSSRARLHEVRDRFFDCVYHNTPHLDLSGCDLEDLPQSLPRSLRSINLSKNQFKSLPGVLSSLADLEKLYLASNPLETMPRFGSLSKLRTLDLSKTHLKVLPQWLCDLPCLETLRLNGTAIFQLPTALIPQLMLTTISCDDQKPTSVEAQLIFQAREALILSEWSTLQARLKIWGLNTSNIPSTKSLASQDLKTLRALQSILSRLEEHVLHVGTRQMLAPLFFELLETALYQGSFKDLLLTIFNNPKLSCRQQLQEAVFQLKLEKAPSIRSKLQIIKKRVCTQALEKAIAQQGQEKSLCADDLHAQLPLLEYLLKQSLELLITFETLNLPQTPLLCKESVIDTTLAHIQKDFPSHPMVMLLAMQDDSIKGQLLVDSLDEPSKLLILKEWLKDLGLL